MKGFLREIIINAISLYVASLFISGLKIDNYIGTYLLGGFFLYIGTSILRPLITIISLPLNLVTFGLFSSFINIIVFYLITLIFPKIKISAFMFGGANLFGIIIPSFPVSILLSYVVISATIYTLTALIKWFLR